MKKLSQLLDRLFGNSPAPDPPPQTPSLIKPSPASSFRPRPAPAPAPAAGGEAPVWPRGKLIAGLYEIRDVLGRGGMGLVYRAHDHATHRPIAIKVPLGRWDFDPTGRPRLVRFVNSPEAKQSLMAEVRAWMALAHPHLVQAFDVHDDETTDYLPAICMDYCDGGSLAGRLAGADGLTLAEGLDVAIQVCWAMEYVHGRGLLHRDLKAANVLLASDGSGPGWKALVTDLGLAKALGAPGLAGSEPADAHEAALWVTVSAAGGTPTHMPPEQWQAGAHVSRASDVYAFGVLLYEVFCRRLPFEGGYGLSGWQRAHEQAAVPDPRQWNRQVPEGLSRLMIQCLAKEAAARPQDFGEVAGRLAEVYRQVTGRRLEAVRPKPAAGKLTAAEERRRAWAKVRLGNGAYRRGDLEAAQREYEEAGEVFQSLGDQAELAGCYGNQAVILKAWGRLEEAMGLLKQQQALSEALGDQAGLQACYGNQAGILIQWGRLEEAMGLLKQKQALCEALGDQAGLSRCYGNQAVILIRWGRLEEAMVLHKKEQALCEALGDQAGLSRCYGNQALILKAWGRLEEAMGLLKQQQALSEALGDQAGLSRCYGNQALILQDWGRLEEAMGLLKQQQALCEALGDQAGLQACYGNQALILQAWGRLEEAMGLLKQKQALCEALGDQVGLSRCYGNQALILQDWGRLEEAMGLHKKEQALCEALGDQAGLAACYGNQALILKAWGRLEEAMRLHKKEQALCEALGLVEGLARSLASQALLLGLELGRRQEALAKIQQALQLCQRAGLSALAEQVKRIQDRIVGGR
jgi:serine/threonine protein kinase